MKKHSFLGLAGLLCLSAFTACSDDDPTPLVAIKEVRITPADNAVSVACTGTAYSLQLDNKNDSVGYDVPVETLKQASMQVTTTVGVGIEAYYQGQLVGDKVTVDATQPIQLEVRGYGQTRSYTVNVYQAHVAGEEPALKSSDMRQMGVNPKAFDFDVTLFNDKFYAVTSSKKEDGVISYQLYASDNGIKWNEVNYTCTNAENQPSAIGGRGARLAVLGNRMYVLGGGRFDGPDEFGNDAELSWGSATVANWRSFSTADGVTFKADIAAAEKKHPDPTCYSTVAVLADKIYYQGGFSGQAFGQWQCGNQFLSSGDGKTYEELNSNIGLQSRHQASYFELNGKLWILGGYNSFISESQFKSDVHSSVDGVNWTKEAETTEIGKIAGAKVVKSDENVLYAFGGECFVDGKQVISDKVYRSTDGIHWEAVKVAALYVPRRSPKVVVKGNIAYIFGGYSDISDGFYGYPTDKDTLFDLYTMTLK